MNLQERLERRTHIVEKVDAGSSFADIARELGLTRERVRAIYATKGKQIGRVFMKKAEGKNWLHRLGANVRRFRRLADKTQEQVAAAAGIDPTEVSRFERGKKKITMRELQKMLKLIGASFSDVWPEGLPVSTGPSPAADEVALMAEQIGFTPQELTKALDESVKEKEKHEA